MNGPNCCCDFLSKSLTRKHEIWNVSLLNQINKFMLIFSLKRKYILVRLSIEKTQIFNVIKSFINFNEEMFIKEVKI